MARIIVGLLLGVVFGIMLSPMFIGASRVIPECAQVTRWEDGSGKWSACDGPSDGHAGAVVFVDHR